MIRLVLLIAFFFVLSCNTNKITENEGVTVNAGIKKPINNFMVSFISIGSGIDTDARKTFKQFIISFEEANDVKLTYVMENWGREGEVNYCFDLRALKQTIQERFISESKDTLKSSSLIRYAENKDCSVTPN